MAGTRRIITASLAGSRGEIQPPAKVRIAIEPVPIPPQNDLSVELWQFQRIRKKFIELSGTGFQTLASELPQIFELLGRRRSVLGFDIVDRDACIVHSYICKRVA